MAAKAINYQNKMPTTTITTTAATKMQANTKNYNNVLLLKIANFLKFLFLFQFFFKLLAKRIFLYFGIQNTSNNNFKNSKMLLSFNGLAELASDHVFWCMRCLCCRRCCCCNPQHALCKSCLLYGYSIVCLSSFFLHWSS